MVVRLKNNCQRGALEGRPMGYLDEREECVDVVFNCISAVGADVVCYSCSLEIGIKDERKKILHNRDLCNRWHVVR